MQKSTQHTFSSPAMKKGKRNGLFRHHEPVKCVIEPLKWRWFALCGKSNNNDLIDNDKAKDDDLYQEMCRVVGKVVLEMRDLGQEPKHIVITGVLRTSLANRKIQRSPLTVEAMEKVIHALSGH